MKKKLTVLALATAAVASLASWSYRADSLAFAPEDDTSVDKQLTFDMTVYMDDLSMLVDGNDMGGMMMGELDEGLLFNAVVGVTDRYVKVAEGRASELLRTYNSLSLEAGPESQSESVDEFADLEDTTVRFKWDEEEGAYVKSFHESTGDDALLENLDVDMDLTMLLPDHEVEPDEKWEVRGEKLATFFLPGGMVMGSPDEEEATEVMEIVKQELETQFDEAFEEFAIVCRYVGVREEEDKKLGEIAFEYEAEASIDLSNLLQTILEMQAQEVEMDASILATLDIELSGEGTLTWDMAAGRVAGFHNSAEITVLADVEADIDAMGEAHTAELSAELSGTAEWQMTAD